MGSFGIWHWLIVLLIVLLIFGARHLRSLGADLAAGLKGFKDAIRHHEQKRSDGVPNDRTRLDKP